MTGNRDGLEEASMAFCPSNGLDESANLDGECAKGTLRSPKASEPSDFVEKISVLLEEHQHYISNKLDHWTARQNVRFDRVTELLTDIQNAGAHHPGGYVHLEAREPRRRPSVEEGPGPGRRLSLEGGPRRLSVELAAPAPAGSTSKRLSMQLGGVQRKLAAVTEDQTPTESKKIGFAAKGSRSSSSQQSDKSKGSGKSHGSSTSGETKVGGCAEEMGMGVTKTLNGNHVKAEPSDESSAKKPPKKKVAMFAVESKESKESNGSGTHNGDKEMKMQAMITQYSLAADKAVRFTSAKSDVWGKVGGTSLFGEEPRFRSQGANELRQKSMAHKNLRRGQFEGRCAMMIVLSSVIMGCATEYQAIHVHSYGVSPSSEPLGAYWCMQMLGHVFNGWFCVELGLRIYIEGFREWANSAHDGGWNIFDLSLVLLWAADTTASHFAQGHTGITALIRTLRSLRVLRILRIFRFLRSMNVLRKMVHACVGSMKTLLWSMLLVTFELYFFAICFTQASVAFIEDNFQKQPEVTNYNEVTTKSDVVNEVTALQGVYGSLRKAYYSLFKSMSGGVSWGEMMDPLFALPMHWFFVLMFLMFIILTIFGILNVVTSIFVESAVSSQTNNRELLVQAKEDNKKMYVSHLRDIFNTIDDDESGYISLQEVEAIFENQQMHKLLEALDIEAFDAHSLFTLLDCDGGGSVDIEEFCEGCLKLKGDAKAFDVQCLIYENQNLARKVHALMRQQDDTLNDVYEYIVNEIGRPIALVQKGLTSLREKSSQHGEVQKRIFQTVHNVHHDIRQSVPPPASMYEDFEEPPSKKSAQEAASHTSAPTAEVVDIPDVLDEDPAKIFERLYEDLTPRLWDQGGDAEYFTVSVDEDDRAQLRLPCRESRAPSFLGVYRL